LERNAKLAIPMLIFVLVNEGEYFIAKIKTILSAIKHCTERKL